MFNDFPKKRQYHNIKHALSMTFHDCPRKSNGFFHGFSRCSFKKHHRDRDPVFSPGKRGNLKKFFMAWIVRRPKERMVQLCNINNNRC